MIIYLVAVLLIGIGGTQEGWGFDPSNPYPEEPVMPEPRSFLPPKYAKPDHYEVVDQAGKTCLLKKIPSGRPSNNIPNCTQFDGHVNRCGPDGGRRATNAQITEVDGFPIQRRIGLGNGPGGEFKLHVCIDPDNPASADCPLFWYDDVENPSRDSSGQIIRNKWGKAKCPRVFINDGFYDYLPDGHPIRQLSGLAPVVRTGAATMIEGADEAMQVWQAVGGALGVRALLGQGFATLAAAVAAAGGTAIMIGGSVVIVVGGGLVIAVIGVAYGPGPQPTFPNPALPPGILISGGNPSVGYNPNSPTFGLPR